MLIVYGLKANSERSDWAHASCATIKEGDIFAECREKVANYEEYYTDCLYDACG
jgi:hypothetical protein